MGHVPASATRRAPGRRLGPRLAGPRRERSRGSPRPARRGEGRAGPITDTGCPGATRTHHKEHKGHKEGGPEKTDFYNTAWPSGSFVPLAVKRERPWLSAWRSWARRAPSAI